jgi:4-amino-4-deoxy-L-arabinose transferase-like glycosyltransferase
MGLRFWRQKAMGRFMDSGQSSRYLDWIWYGLISVCVLVILITFQSYGVTSDAHHHVKYGRDIARWYTSLFADQSVFNSVNTWLYGGFFDLTVYVLSLVSPFDVHDTRHLISALIGLLGVGAAYQIGCGLGGKRAGVLAALCLVLTPRYYGHAFNNTKDIPFAVFYLWGLYYLIRSLDLLPLVTRSGWMKLGVAIGLTMAIRVIGIVLLFYVGLFWFIRLALSPGGLSGFFSARVLVPYTRVALLAYGVLLPFWPWLQVHPITGIWDGVSMFAAFSEVHFSFFEGHYIASDAIPWYYAFKWLLLTMPEFVLVGWAFAIFWFLFLLHRKGRGDVLVLQWTVLWFGGLFPLMY